MPTTLRPVDRPLAWVGHERILLSDVTSLGLHRKVIARKEEIPNVVTWLQAAYQEAGQARVHWWLLDKPDGYFYLWIVWKEGR